MTTKTKARAGRKVHYDTDPDKQHGITRCGTDFWRAPNMVGEGDTALDHRIEFTDEPKRVTCKRCKNGMQADWVLGA